MQRPLLVFYIFHNLVTIFLYEIALFGFSFSIYQMWNCTEKLVKAENEAVSDSFLKNILLGDDFFL
jgi:hypothetical protein